MTAGPRLQGLGAESQQAKWREGPNTEGIPCVRSWSLHVLSHLTSFSQSLGGRNYIDSHKVTEEINSRPGIQTPRHTKRQSNLLPTHRSRPEEWGASLNSTSSWLRILFFVFLYCSPSTLSCDQSWVQISILPLPSCVDLGKLSNLSGLSFSVR